ncbi:MULTISPECIES: TetR/AcrR family transcriptional regulator [Streptomyces]|uniref:TetR/AcrR family transcriptional regulator n=1 Tax=Streptomyces TaxID=1883 RepID=UPI000AD10AD9|nr:TetR/AcrR family transcriptional regulator [Streptomyces sp. CGMCC 4.1456]WNF62268.1 TetR/AcrR family transcriptional regulator [Streptomyces sp. CGMCC 4.1456]
MPRDTLTADRIVHAAIELLDEEGLDGLNMRSLAKRLGSAATAVYWHIKTKDDLVRLASDTVWHEVEPPDLDATDWRTAATAHADGMHAMLTRHPWLVQAFGSHLLYGPGQARYNDVSLAVYEKAGFAADDADRAAGTVFTFVLGSTLGPAAQVSLNRRLGRNGADAEQLLADAVARATETAMEFPRLRERLGTKAATEYAAAPDSTFEFGLRSLLDGFEARLAADGAGRRE